MNLALLSASCLYKPLIFPKTVRKASLRIVMQPAAQGYLIAELQSGKEGVDPKEKKRKKIKTQTWGLPSKTYDKQLKAKAKWLLYDPGRPKEACTLRKVSRAAASYTAEDISTCLKVIKFPLCLQRTCFQECTWSTELPTLFFKHLGFLPICSSVCLLAC